MRKYNVGLEIGGKQTKATDLFHATSELPLYVKAMIRDNKYSLIAFKKMTY